MAICPEHGAYEGTCKKCQPNDPGPAKMKEDPSMSMAEAREWKATKAANAPSIPDPDKYILRSFEVECLTAQIETQNAQQKWQATQQALNRHAQVVFEKLGISPKDWILDTKSMTLVKRGE